MNKNEETTSKQGTINQKIMDQHKKEIKKGNLAYFQKLYDEGKLSIEEITFLCHAAAREGQFEIVEWFVEKGADLEIMDQHAEAIKRGDLAYFQKLYAEGKLFVKEEITFLCYAAARKDKSEIVKWFADIVEIMDQHEKAIKEGNLAYFQNHDKGKLFVNGRLIVGSRKEGEDYKRETTPLCYAAQKGEWEIVKWLIENGADIESKDEDGNTALSLATEYTHKAIVEFLIKAGADVTTKNKHGTGLLHHMAFKVKDKELINLIIEEVKNIDAKKVDDLNNKGETPTIIAALKGNTEALEALLKAGASLDIANSNGTPLHNAARMGEVGCMKILLERISGIDKKTYIDEKTGDNHYTALHYAVERNHIRAVKFLIANGANLSAECRLCKLDELGEKYKYYLTPLELAAKNAHPEVVKVLLPKVKTVLSDGEFRKTIEKSLDLVKSNKNKNIDEDARKEVIKILNSYLLENSITSGMEGLSFYGVFSQATPQTTPEVKDHATPSPQQ